MRKPIQTIEIGDEVLSWDAEKGVYPGIVVMTFETAPELVYNVHLRKDQDEQTLQCTANHPFYAVEQNGFVEVDAITPGLHFRDERGQKWEFVMIIPARGPPADGWKTFNLSVEPAHTYFVADSTDPTDAAILVHNEGAGRECTKVVKQFGSSGQFDDLLEGQAKSAVRDSKGVLRSKNGQFAFDESIVRT
ncbi:MAG: hypothetical protein H6510_07310, partial [Acidobacteria bacterium]|nr:hypothetical protein [Acidobacteriota bacterium]